MKAIFRRKGDTLVPACQEALKVLGMIGEGNEAIIEYKQGRSSKNHRRFFAFLNIAYDRQETFDDKEVFRKYLEMSAGHYTEIISPKTGQPMYIAKSINWDELDETAFKELFNRCVQAFLDRFGQELSPEELTLIVGF